MPDYRTQIDELIARADLLATGAMKVALVEEAIRLADLHGDPEEGFWLRDELIDAALHSGYPEKALVAFTWCLAQCDRDPARFPEDSDLLWVYKWFCQELPKFPEITQAQIEQTFADMTARYQRAGSSLRAVYQLRTMAATIMGDRSAAKTWERKWQEAASDGSNDCPACELHYRLDCLLLLEDNIERALATVTPILEERLCCSEIPHLTLGLVLLPLIQQERWQEAARLHLRGYRLVARNRRYLKTVGEHLLFLTLAREFERALSLLEQHLIWALESRDLYGSFYFYRACYLLLRQLQSDRSELRMLLPSRFPNYRTDGCYELNAITAWFEDITEHIARRFDSRNGNRFFSNELGVLADLKELRPQQPLNF